MGVKAGAKAQLAAVDDTAIKHEMDSFMVVSFGRSEPGWLVLVCGCWLTDVSSTDAWNSSLPLLCRSFHLPRHFFTFHSQRYN